MPTPHERDRELILTTLRADGLAAFESLALEIAEPSVQLKTTRANVPVGGSKIGGAPDLPPGESWPSARGVPFSFIGQLDVAEVNRHLPSSPLPDAGLLLFFFDTSDFHLGRDVCRVIHAKGPVTRRAAPDAREEIFLRFPECELTFTAASAVPDLGMGAYDDRISHLDEETRSELERWSRRAQDALSQFGHEVLGYPRWVQPIDPLVELAMCDEPKLDVRDAHRRWATAQTRRQLIAFDSDMEANMPWADGGRLWFMIGVDDLARHDFSQVAAVAQTY